ncbi:Kexin [Escovopsis weberi]|uniref:Kexin n=1 Tax=Escovopsis weberi TaxID=150374 RepID=A0A0M8N7L8_ESCWE|nr:Kexin [Escovopsis weberi]
MKVASLFLGLGLAGQALASTSSSSSSPPSGARDYDSNDYYVLHLDETTRPADVAQRLGLDYQGPLGQMSDHHVYRADKHQDDVVNPEIRAWRRRRRRRRRDVNGDGDAGQQDALDGVLMARKQHARRRLFPRVIPPRPKGIPPPDVGGSANAQAVQKQNDVMVQLGISDPIFADQWHLFNPVQLGHDVNVTDLWLEGITGKNSTVAMVDDGVDMYSRDLAPNYFAKGSWDFNDPGPEPRPRLADDRHGTRCAGEISAARNDVCGVGVAYDSKIAGIRILSKAISDADEAEAMIYKYQDNQIYSCSWGPPDDGRTMEAPDVLISRAMIKGIKEGRGGRGSIYVFASGNGAVSGDNCNFDGYTNSIFSITVGAVGRDGRQTFYSEHCSAQLVVTYSSGGGDGIHTTDVGENVCTSAHGGTSAAAPLAAGIFALVLQARPDLTWRDLQYLLVETAVKLEDAGSDDWQLTATGKPFSHAFGYGKIDSYSLVQRAKTWENVKPQAWLASPRQIVNHNIPEGQNGLVATLDITEDMLKEANLARLEHVTVTMKIDHTRRGDLSVDLVSPQSVISHLSVARPQDEAEEGYNNWTFMSVAHWGESAVGTWTIIVRDTEKNGHHGKFMDWHLNLWGESIDASKARPLPLPKSPDDEEDPEPPAAGPISDHPVRPTKPGAGASPSSKPVDTEHEAAPDTDSETPQPSPSSPASPSSSSSSSSSSASSSSSSWIEWLPTFGAPKTARVWIYGSLGLIGVFCCGLAVYFWIARRRRLRNDPRNNYEFELLDEEEGENLNGVEKGKAGGGGGGGSGVARKGSRRTRGGELYDAFAGGSDDEDEFDEYRDRAAARLHGREDHDDDDDDDDERDSGEGGSGRTRRGQGASH